MTTLDLRSLRLRSGEVRKETLDVEFEPFVLGGLRYDVSPDRVPVTLEISQASGATVFDLRFSARLAGACMRCLGFAELEREVSAREFYDPDTPRGKRRLTLRLRRERPACGGAWARDAFALEVP